MKHKTVYLINNKKKEPEFSTAFKKVAKEKKILFQKHFSTDISYYYDRKSNDIHLFVNGKKISLENTSWFLRRWAPSEDSTALLALVLELQKIPFNDSRINSLHEIRTSKISQSFQFAMAGCKSPNTWVVPVHQFSLLQEKIEKSLQFPIIVKARGGLGNRVWQCKNKTTLKKLVSELKKTEDLVIFQENIENDGDIRVIVFKGKILASLLRTNKDTFLNNVSQGGHAETIKITTEEARIAKRAARAVRIDLAGVDIVRSPHGPLLFEVNKAPDITSFNAAAGFNIAEKIAEHYLEDLKK